MKVFNFLILLVLMSMIVSCKDDCKRVNDINVVSGIYFRDEVANPVGFVGLPNENAENFVSYPNPAVGIISLVSFKTMNSIDIVPSSSVKGIAEEDNCLLDFSFDINEIASKAVISQDLEVSQVSLQLIDLEAGYYRIFVRFDDNTREVSNIYIDPSQNLQDIYEYVIDEWN